MSRRTRLIVAFISVLLVIASGLVAYKQFKNNLVDYYADNYVERTTPLPATTTPDQVCLTWNDDPRVSQAVQWRASKEVKDGVVQWREKSADPAAVTATEATRVDIEDPMLKNDPVISHFTATLRNLVPATCYMYRVGSKTTDKWSEWSEFNTAPDKPVDFSFIYMGDPQLGLEYWGKLVKKAQEQYTNTAFHIIAGDLVNSGNWRNEWDRFFDGGRGVFDQKPLVPVLGNHDYDKSSTPRIYLESFALGENGPKGVTPEAAYSFEYGNALFVILDSNRELEAQTPWLEEKLKNSKATWKFVSYHHPAYCSKDSRDNGYVRDVWGAVFDKYHVDFAFQGHDHAYLRTYPMHAGKRVDSAKDGTYYVVSVSGTKYYDQGKFDYAAVAFARTSTYQTIDIKTNPDRFIYRCYDFDGKQRDEVIIEK